MRVCDTATTTQRAATNKLPGATIFARCKRTADVQQEHFRSKTMQNHIKWHEAQADKIGSFYGFLLSLFRSFEELLGFGRCVARLPNLIAWYLLMLQIVRAKWRRRYPQMPFGECCYFNPENDKFCCWNMTTWCTFINWHYKSLIDHNEREINRIQFCQPVWFESRDQMTTP